MPHIVSGFPMRQRHSSIASSGSLILPLNSLWHQDPHNYPWIHFFIHSRNRGAQPPKIAQSHLSDATGSVTHPHTHHQPSCKSHPGFLAPLVFLAHPRCELYCTWLQGPPTHTHPFLAPSPGHIDVSEIQQSFRALGISISLEQAEKILHR